MNRFEFEVNKVKIEAKMLVCFSSCSMGQVRPYGCVVVFFSCI